MLKTNFFILSASIPSLFNLKNNSLLLSVNARLLMLISVDR
jgi:hypothetical protein